MVQAAGNHRAVAEDTDLVPEPVAEYTAAPIRGRQIRPVEFVAVLQKDPVSDSGSLALGGPGLGEMGFQSGQNFAVFLVFKVVVEVGLPC